ncbi:hypothetical protein NUACC21_32620 [Scytonema sp. NUACC21]
MNTNEIMNSLWSICAIGSGVFWVLTYVAIIWRGFKDRSFGMPIVALSANISWEAIYSFIYIPPGQLLHFSSIAWFFFDLPIALQCFLYGANDFKSPIIKKNFHAIFLATIAICFAIILAIVYEFNDTRGVYTGFGQNLIMSILFICMLIRRDDLSGQSLYIAFFKFMGTLFAFLSLLFVFPADINTPLSLQAAITQIISSNTYPLTPLIKIVYLATLMFDVLYIVLLYRNCRERKINPWTRFLLTSNPA